MGNEASYVMCILTVCVRAAQFREKRCLVRKMREFSFFLEFLYFPEARLLVILCKGSIWAKWQQGNFIYWSLANAISSCLTLLLTGDTLACMHACIDTYIHTHTHTPRCWQADTHACIYTQGAGGWLILHIAESKEISLLCLDLVCGLTATKPCVQMNTIKNHFAPKHVYSWAQLVLGLKCIPFVLSAKIISYARVESPN